MTTRERTAIVFVDKNWYDRSLRRLVGSQPSQSAGHHHLLIGPLKDAGDPNGLWMKGITSGELKKDGSKVTMEFLIPWRFVDGVGVVDEANTRIGFEGSDVTVLK